jgi:isopentenyldiphosphate isomerase
MPDEVVEVINEKDEIIGKEMKSVCHKKGLWHRISCVLLINSEGKIWLQTRKKSKIAGGFLDYSAAGHVSIGDTFQEAAYRELSEEIGVKADLKLATQTLYEKIDMQGYQVRHVLKVYIGKHNGPFKIQESELEKIEAYSIEEVKKLVKNDSPLMTEALKVGLREILENNSLISLSP